MAGGRGSRFDADVEKPLVRVGGRPMVDHVRRALAASRVATVHAVVSPHAPETRAHLAGQSTIETPGAGYVADLTRALDRLDPPVLTVGADLPLLDGRAVDAVLRAHDRDSLAVCVPAALKRTLGASVDAALVRAGGRLVPAGINVVAGTADEDVLETADARYAVNVNRRADARLAEARL